MDTTVASLRPPHKPHSDGFAAGVHGQVAAVTVAIFECERLAPGEPTDFLARARRVFAAAHGPSAVHVGQARRADGRAFEIAIGYWLAAGDFAAWEHAHPWPAWCATDAYAAQDLGLSRQMFTVRSDRLETLLSAADIRHGLSACGLPVVGPVPDHGYWGSMRDRIPALAGEARRVDAAGATVAVTGHRATAPAAAAPADYGDWGIATVIEPPAELCVILSGQDWSRCSPEHAAFFHETLRTKLDVAMASLARNATRHGCVDLRTVDLVDEAGTARDAGFVLAMFHRLDQLEHWARTDPEHLDIFGSFIAHKRATRTALRLWHEVMLLPARGIARFEYLRLAPPRALQGEGASPAVPDHEEPR